MPLRILEVILPADAADRARAMVDESAHHGAWQDELSDGLVRLRILVATADTEPLIDRLASRFKVHDEFRLMIQDVEATVPRIEEAAAIKTPDPGAAAVPRRRQRIAREELYAEVTKATSSSWMFVTFSALSTLVACTGLMRDSAAVIIGAMVVAPLLGPNMALALAVTLGDGKLAKRSILINLVGSGVAFCIAFLVGAFLPVDVGAEELMARTVVSVADIALALASGILGALAFTTGASATLVGVMVAVALLPPLATMAMMLASGHVELANGAGMLLATNVICVNLAAVATFLVQGIRPMSWRDAHRARRATVTAICIWLLLLTILTLLIMAENPVFPAPVRIPVVP